MLAVCTLPLTLGTLSVGCSGSGIFSLLCCEPAKL